MVGDDGLTEDEAQRIWLERLAGERYLHSMRTPLNPLEQRALDATRAQFRALRIARKVVKANEELMRRLEDQ